MLRCAWVALVTLSCICCTADEQPFVVEQFTHGPRHHFFGYIGQAGTIPWSGDGRYALTLETTFHDRMPTAEDEAGIGLIDTRDGNRLDLVERTRAWNFQQGTMFYWNPERPSTQFFFNDRDPATQRVFCVLYDVTEKRRIAEFRFDDASIGNAGVCPTGGRFAAINYGRLARLRPVTGYPEAFDGTRNVDHPADDGVFIVDVASRDKHLLVSFQRLAELLRGAGRDVERKSLFINHTLWNRACDRLFFFVRASFDDADRINVPCVVHPDGSGLKIVRFLGGHPEWDAAGRLVGNDGDRLVLYDVERDEIVRTIGTSDELGEVGGDKSVSPDGRRLVNGSRRGSKNRYVVVDLNDGRRWNSPMFDVGAWTKGDLRIDPAPCWNRTGNAILASALDREPLQTRQLFIWRLR